MARRPRPAASIEGGEYLVALLRRATRELEGLEQIGLGRSRARLRPAHVPILSALLEASPLTPGELSARCEIAPTTMTGLLRALEEEGLIARERLVQDERTQAISLTARGRAASRVAARTRAWAQERVLGALPPESARTIVHLLASLAAAAETSAAEALAEGRGRR